MTTKNIPENIDYPAWVKWIAQDRDGSWWGYSVEPLENHAGWYENEVGDYILLLKTETNENWKDSLIKLG